MDEAVDECKSDVFLGLGSQISTCTASYSKAVAKAKLHKCHVNDGEDIEEKSYHLAFVIGGVVVAKLSDDEERKTGMRRIF